MCVVECVYVPVNETQSFTILPHAKAQSREGRAGFFALFAALRENCEVLKLAFVSEDENGTYRVFIP